MGFWDDVRNGRDQVRAASGAPRVDRDRRQNRDPWDDRTTGGQAPDSAELENALRIVSELTAYAQQQESRIIELINALEPMANVLQLPGVKKFLLLRFHPDQHANSSEQESEVFKKAMQDINAAYAFIAKEPQSASD